MVTDLPDGTKYMAITVTAEMPNPINVLPFADKKGDGNSATSTAAYTEIATYAPINGKTGRLVKIVVAVTTASLVRVVVDTENLEPYILPDESSVIDWFPRGDVFKIVGDGSKAFKIEVQARTANGYAYASIYGYEE